MSAVGADLQSTNNELVSIVEELKDRRDELDRAIQADTDAKLRLVQEIRTLSAQLAKVEASLQKKIAVRADFDRTIDETTSAFASILDSSKVLLSSVKRESVSLVTKSVDA
jgi:Sjoegren syndrome nuclear autoantigen 1